MPGVQNPPTLDSTDTFKAYAYSSNSEIIDQVTSGVSISMTTAALMKTSTLSLASYVNDAFTNYTFTLAASIPIPSSSKVRIIFPPEVTIPSTSSDIVCLSNTTSYIDSLSCSLYTAISNAIDIRLNLKLSPLAAG